MKNIRYLMTQPQISVRQRCWVDFLTEYDYEENNFIVKENKVVDAFSRIQQLATITQAQPNLQSLMIPPSLDDEFYIEVCEDLHRKDTLGKKEARKHEGYRLVADEFVIWHG